MENMKYLNEETFEQKIQREYEEASAEQLIDLLNKSAVHLVSYQHLIQHERGVFIKSVINTARQSRCLSFKQWKALKGFCKDIDKISAPNTSKTF
jgi:hypothetical protein